MLKVVVLDDYQEVTHKFANWSKLDGKIELKIFNKFIDNEQDLIKNLSDAHIICLMRERTKLTSNIINKLQNLKLVVTSGMWNASVDDVELKKNNVIFSGTDNIYHSTAELAWLLAMLVWRGIKKEIDNMGNGNWQTEIGRSMFGKTLGIFGLGRQGRQVANFGKAFGMKVIAWSHNLTKEACIKENVIYCNEEEFFKDLDILTIHTKLSDRTNNFVNLKKISIMKKSSIIINTSRGPIINENDLIYAIENKIISGAGLDVYDIEPLGGKHKLRKLSKNFNMVLTPHIGYVSEETYGKFHEGYVKAIEAFLNGKPINILN